MKKRTLILLIMLSSLSLMAQQWKYEKLNDTFNGEFHITYIEGIGEYRYSSPVFGLRYYVNEQNFTFLLYNVIPAFCQELDIKIAFDKSGHIFEITDISLSNDNDTWFFSYDQYLIDEIKSNNKMIIRLSTGCSQSDYIFNLNNSTKSIELFFKNINKYLITE